MRATLRAIPLLTVAALLVRCSGPVETAGGAGGETTNGFTAAVVYPNGTPASGAVVRIRRAEYLADTASAVGKSLAPAGDELTGDDGLVAVDSLDSGAYLVEVVDASGNGAVVAATAAGDSVIDLGTITLARMGTIGGSVRGASPLAYVRLRGLERAVKTGSDGRFLIAAPEGIAYTLNAGDADTSVELTLAAPLRAGQETTVTLDVGTFRADSLVVGAFLDSMGLDSLDVGAVIGTQPDGRIRDLRLSGLGLSSLHASIGDLQSLWHLYLDSNALTALPPELADLPDLGVLTISGNPLDSLPPVVANLPNLRMLVVNNTRIATLPDDLARCRTLEVIWMENTGATEFPPVAALLPNLFGINISGNRLVALSPAFVACTALEEVDISSNLIDSLPADIGSLTRLRILYAYSNRLTALPASVGQLAALEILHLESNLLTSLPPELGALTKLTNLNLRSNDLASLPDAVTGMSPTGELFVAGNGLCAVAPAVEAWLNTYAETGWKTLQQGCP